MENSFRGGVTSCTDEKWDLKEIEKYTEAKLTTIWNTCDTRVTHANPGGPAIVEVIQFDMMNMEDKNHKTVIYSLPIERKENEDTYLTYKKKKQRKTN